jgi:hypothetical protein
MQQRHTQNHVDSVDDNEAQAAQIDSVSEPPDDQIWNKPGHEGTNIKSQQIRTKESLTEAGEISTAATYQEGE